MRLICPYISTLFLTFFVAFDVKAQAPNLTISFTDTKIKSTINGTVEALLKLKNTGNVPIEGFLAISSASTDLYLVQRKPRAISLKEKDSVFMVVKAIVSNAASPERPVVLKATFINLASQEEKTASLIVQIQEKRLVRMLLPQVNLFYEHIGDSIQIPIRVFNDGNKAQNVTILAKYPPFINASELKKISINIKQFTDTLIVFKKAITRDILAQEDFPMTITALYNNGDVIGIANVDAHTIKQNRRYTPRYLSEDDYVLNMANQITVSRQSSNNNDQMFALYANAQGQTSKGRFYANADVNWWEQSNLMFMRNTWVGYKGKSFGVQAGNVVKFNELNLIGRGVEAFYNLTDKSTLEVGAVEKSYSVIDYSLPSLGQSGWISFFSKGAWQKGHKTSFLYDNNTYEKIKRALVNSHFSVINSPNFSLQVGTAISQLYANQYLDPKWGGAAEINFHGKTSQLFYNSSNYISSGYFAGIRSGALNLNESIYYNFKNYSFWVLANHFSFAPKTFNHTFFQASQFANTQINFGISKSFSAVLVSLLLASVSEKRTQPEFFSHVMQGYKMQTNRLNFTVNYYKNNQNINISLEGGAFKTNINPNRTFQFRSNFNYSWKFFNLMGYYQYNNFDLGEIITFRPTDQKTYYNFIVAPAVQTELFRQKMSLKGGLMYAKNSFMARSLQLTSRVDFKWNKNLTLFASNFYSDYSRDFKPANSVHFGVTKRFNPVQMDKTKSDLEIYMFYDTGRQGDKKLPCANQLVIINGVAFRSNEQGIIKYKNLPKGEYEIRTVNNNEWYAPSRKVTIEKSLKLEIGLVKTRVIRGTVKYVATANAFPVEQKLAGLSVILTDELGMVFTTKTDELGNFVFYVPKNNYSLTLDPSALSEYVTLVPNQIMINPNSETDQEFTFVLQVKEKRIEIKKFGSKKF